MVGAHASFTLSEETLAACASCARQAGVGIHIHVAEDDADQRDCYERYCRRVLDRLHGAGIVTDRALLAHCVHVDDAEIRIVASSGATVVCNPRSNMNNSVGRSPFNGLPGRVCLGTDGIGGDMISESQAGFFRAKDDDVLTPPSWPLARLAEGARLAGRIYGEPLLGTLRPGAPADLAVYDYGAPTPVTSENLAGHWVFGISPRQVRDVYVAGECVVSDRRSTRVDEAEVAHDSSKLAEELWRRMEAIPAHDYEPRGGQR